MWLISLEPRDGLSDAFLSKRLIALIVLYLPEEDLTVRSVALSEAMKQSHQMSVFRIKEEISIDGLIHMPREPLAFATKGDRDIISHRCKKNYTTFAYDIYSFLIVRERIRL